MLIVISLKLTEITFLFSDVVQGKVSTVVHDVAKKDSHVTDDSTVKEGIRQETRYEPEASINVHNCDDRRQH